MSSRARRTETALLLAALAYALVALWGTGQVPFHPDETTHLYMSRDFDLLFVHGQPAAVAWSAPDQPGLVLRYRLLDAPLSRYLVGLARALAGYGGATFDSDWDWSATWEANAAAGAVPAAGLLHAARLPAALLTAFSPLLVYAIGRRMRGPALGALAAALYALSGLTLLHGRRAMSEGPLLFFWLLTLWLLVRARPRPALMGLSAALAVAAKLNGLALLPVAVLGLLWLPAPALARRAAWIMRGRALAVFGLVFTTASLALNPALWVAPAAGLRTMLAARAQFLNEQTQVVGALAPHTLLAEPGLRALAMVYHVYFAPPAYADIGNYAAHTRAAEAAYQANPMHIGWHTPVLNTNLILGAALLGLTLLGLALAMREWLAAARATSSTARVDAASEAGSTRATALVVVCTIVAAGSLLSIQVPMQRYYLPLLPLACLWAARGALAAWEPLRQRRAAVRASAEGVGA